MFGDRWQWWKLLPWLYEWKSYAWFHTDGSYIGTAWWKERKGWRD